jgi:hypothetical protein
VGARERAEAERLQRELQDAHLATASARSGLQLKHDEVARLSASVHDFERELVAMRNSTLWRMTGPLRAAVNMFRKK